MNLVRWNEVAANKATSRHRRRAVNQVLRSMFGSRPKYRGLWVFGAVACGFAVCSVTSAANRTPEEAREVPLKPIEHRAQVIQESERPTLLGYYVRGDEVSVTFSTENQQLAYEDACATDTDESLNPEHFVRMWGSREGMAALAEAMSSLLSGKAINVLRSDLLTGTRWGSADGVAIFEEDGVTHLLLVRLDGRETMFEVIVGVATGCSASPPNSSCSCNASGNGATCNYGTTGGVDWAKCRDGNVPNPDQSNCDAYGGSCRCAVTATQ